MPFNIVVTNGHVATSNLPIDWQEVKRSIIARLGPDGVLREFEALGVKLDGGINPQTGKVQCHAMDRPDERASAFLELNKGIYHAKGENSETLNLFDFAMRYGGASFGDWVGTIKAYAERVGLGDAVKGVRKDGKGRILEETYDYTDAAGDLLYQVLRYRTASGKKDFRQRRPDPKGGWLYDLDGVERVLYRLPDLTDLPNALVIVCEGEKDCDRLLAEIGAAEALGSMVATTNAQGSNDTARWDSYRETLRGRSVVVVPDNDPSGLKHARGIAERLHGVAASVRLLDPLPGVGPKGDLSDWLDLGNELKGLVRLIAEAKPFDPSVPAPEIKEDDSKRDATFQDLIDADAGTKWLWPRWIPLGVLTLLTAEPNTGKTRFGLDLTKRIGLGLDWPDGQKMDIGDRKPVVVWVAADSQHSELNDSVKTHGYPASTGILNTFADDIYGGTDLQSEEQLRNLEERIIRRHPALVIIDTITNTSDMKSQDTSDAKRQYKPLQQIAKRTGTAILCVTHTNLAGKTLGKRADEKTRVTIRLTMPDPAQAKRRKLEVALSRLTVLPPALGVTMGDHGNDYDGDPPREVSTSAGSVQALPKTLPPSTVLAIVFLHERLRFGPARVSEVRKEGLNRTPAIGPKALYAAKALMGIREDEIEDRKWWTLGAKPGTTPDEPDDDRPTF